MANQARVKMADINYPPAGFINNSLCVRLNHKKYHTFGQKKNISQAHRFIRQMISIAKK